MRLPLLLATLGLLAGCSSLPPEAARALPADLLLLGEQHDAPAHQSLHLRTVRDLAARGQLAALALEMADQGGSSAGLPRDASEGDVRAALRWNPQAWPWEPYAPAVMAAVRAGVPVLGANLPRERMREAMADATLQRPADSGFVPTGKQGIHSEHLGFVLAEMQSLARQHPGATW